MTENKKESLGVRIINYLPILEIFIIVVCGAVVFILASYIISEKENNYYREQLPAVCELANQYRNLTITLVPEYTEKLAPALDCNMISLKGGIK